MLNDYDAAIESYQRGLEQDPNNAACTEGLAQAEAKKNPSLSRAPAPGAGGMPDMSNLASMLGGAGGGGLANVLQNPAFQQMAQGMMQNPAMMQMAQNMMQDPSMMQNLMQNLGGAGGGAGAAGGSPGGGGGERGGEPDLSGLLNPEVMARLQSSPEIQNLRKVTS